jgi:hypothetical protein
VGQQPLFHSRAHQFGTEIPAKYAGSKARRLHFPTRHGAGDARLTKDFFVIAFATLAGFTASGILANLYRLLAQKPVSAAGRVGYVAVMIVAGPNVLFENAATSFRAKDCSRFAFFLAASIAAYWSFGLGLFVIQFGQLIGRHFAGT